MNIFYLDTDIDECAKAHCDKHVVKMLTEYAQILSTALHKNANSKDSAELIDYVYKASYVNHPACVWAAKSRANFLWLCELGIALYKEYNRRYAKEHKAYQIILNAKYFHWLIKPGELTERPQCMPEEYRHANPVEAYRAYYRGEKMHFATWKAPAQSPAWIGA